MYKKIIEGQDLTITGFNLYPDSTQVFFNNTGYEVPVLTGSFNASFTEVGVTVPCCLPNLNDVIVYNGINYVTGDKKYRFYGSPQFSGITDDSLLWGQSALISGAYLSQTTGVTVDSVESKHYIESDNSVVFTCPYDISIGERDVNVKTKGGEFTTQITIGEPPIEGTLSALSSSSGLKFGESGFIEGVSLHKVNRVIVSGYSEELYIAGPDIVASGSSGLSFLVPNTTINGHPVKIQYQTGYYSEGNYYETIVSEAVTYNN